MPWRDLSRFANDSTRRLNVVYIDETAWNRTGRIPGANNIPLATLYSRINQLPMDRPIVIVADNSVEAAIAMTILRMSGYNAWIAERPASWSTGPTTGGTTTGSISAGGTTAGGSMVGGSTTTGTTTTGMETTGTTTTGTTTTGATAIGSTTAL